MEEEKIYLHYDEKGVILGFYFNSIHENNIPNPNIEITKEKYNFYMKNNGAYKLNISTLEDILILEESKPSEMDKIKADIDYIMIMTGL